ncbi:MAG: GntR family transcriptional regulator [Atopobiaceae bacterium]|jgi:GntR family transcriptional regulator|nr:GntR family transcriptional regulator [Atopobiaceae bacterium]
MLKYEVVASDLRNRIESGQYKANEQLPTIAEMCKIYGVSEITVKKATEQLAGIGLISTRKGSGSYVKGDVGAFLRDPSAEMSGQMAGFKAEHEQLGAEVTSLVKTFEVIHPEPEVAERLSADAADFVYRIVRVRLADGMPLVVEYTYMPISIVPGLRLADVESSIYEHIEQGLGLRIDSAHRIVRAVMPTPQEREWLGLAPDTPLLEVEQVGFLDDGRPFEYSVARHSGDRYSFHAVAKH